MPFLLAVFNSWETKTVRSFLVPLFILGSRPALFFDAPSAPSCFFFLPTPNNSSDRLLPVRDCTMGRTNIRRTAITITNAICSVDIFSIRYCSSLDSRLKDLTRAKPDMGIIFRFP